MARSSSGWPPWTDGSTSRARPSRPEEDVAPPEVAVEERGATHREELGQPVDDRADGPLEPAAGREVERPGSL